MANMSVFEVGGRYLVSSPASSGFEIRITEVSPSGNWARISYRRAGEHFEEWSKVKDLTLIERLPEPPRGPGGRPLRPPPAPRAGPGRLRK